MKDILLLAYTIQVKFNYRSNKHLKAIPMVTDAPLSFSVNTKWAKTVCVLSSPLICVRHVTVSNMWHVTVTCEIVWHVTVSDMSLCLTCHCV